MNNILITIYTKFTIELVHMKHFADDKYKYIEFYKL
jgi:hypothetical protein